VLALSRGSLLKFKEHQLLGLFRTEGHLLTKFERVLIFSSFIIITVCEKGADKLNPKIYSHILIAIAVMLLSALPVHAEKWTMDEFMIGVLGEPGDETMARAYQDAHFNTVRAPIEKLEMCGKYGLKVLVLYASPETAAANKDNPLVWGWYIKDEPKRDVFENMAKRVAAFQARDPNHPSFINMSSRMDLDTYFEIVNPPVLSYDYYQWWWGTSMQFAYLDQNRQAAIKYGVPLVVFVEATADSRWRTGDPDASYLPDNEAKLRQSVYTAVAYGVKGIQWFKDSFIFEHAADGTLLPQLQQSGEDIKKINEELEALGPILIKLQSTGVYNTAPAVLRMDTMPKKLKVDARGVIHVSPAALRTDILPKNLWVQTKDDNLTLGLFEDSDTRYVMVVNRDITKSNIVRLDFKGTVNKLSRFDRQQGQWVEEPAKNTINLELKAGDGELLKVE
jgi:hypothetical protein